MYDAYDLERYEVYRDGDSVVFEPMNPTLTQPADR